MTDGTGCYRDSLTGYERSSYSTLFANSAYRLKPDGMGLWPSKSMMKTLVALIGNAHSTDSRCFIRNAWNAERIASGNDDCGTDADIMIQVFDYELAANWNPDGITSMIHNENIIGAINRIGAHPYDVFKNLCELQYEGLNDELILALLRMSSNNKVLRKALLAGSYDVIELMEAFGRIGYDENAFKWLWDSCLKWNHDAGLTVLFILNHMTEINACAVSSSDAMVFRDAVMNVNYDIGTQPKPVINGFIPLMRSVETVKTGIIMINALHYYPMFTDDYFHTPYDEDYHGGKSFISLFHNIVNDYYNNGVNGFIDDMLAMPVEYLKQAWFIALDDWKNDDSRLFGIMPSLKAL